MYNNKLRSILEYHGTPFFIKTKIKNSFVTQGIFHSELRHTTTRSYETKQWKNWLRGHYQYNLSQIRWSGLIPKKWRTTINEGDMTQNKDLTKWNSYEKDRLLYHKKQKDFKVYPLPRQKYNFTKYYIYDLLSYKYINYEINKSSYMSYGSPSELNNNQKITFNYNNYKQNLFESLEEIPINHYLEKGDIMYIQKNSDRKYFDWTIINFFIRKKKILKPGPKWIITVI